MSCKATKSQGTLSVLPGESYLKKRNNCLDTSNQIQRHPSHTITPIQKQGRSFVFSHLALPTAGRSFPSKSDGNKCSRRHGSSRTDCLSCQSILGKIPDSMFRKLPDLVVKLFSFKETKKELTCQLVACGCGKEIVPAISPVKGHQNLVAA